MPTAVRVLVVLMAVLMVAVGALWTAQGLGYIGDASTEDDGSFATIGPIVAGLGVALAIVGLQRRS